ncbi:hypothetical protein BIW11_08661, partial [Tropilaelaps mercedesae]
ALSRLWEAQGTPRHRNPTLNTRRIPVSKCRKVVGLRTVSRQRRSTISFKLSSLLKSSRVSIPEFCHPLHEVHCTATQSYQTELKIHLASTADSQLFSELKPIQYRTWSRILKVSGFI